ncbi:hypothetical protein SLS56_006054 [Neofusicoccum ribis]|uniref:Uncharacterized protein n=1 Tax=Neofusicoccum ribis TaxID=45134 RepID=A0ABR3SRP2_9PEZI
MIPPYKFRRANNILAYLRRTAIRYAERGDPTDRVERDFTKVTKYALKYIESRKAWSLKYKNAIK